MLHVAAIIIVIIFSQMPHIFNMVSLSLYIVFQKYNIYLVVYLLSMYSEDIAFILLVKSYLFLVDIQPARWRSCPGRSAAWYDLSEANHGAGKIVATTDPEDFPSWI